MFRAAEAGFGKLRGVRLFGDCPKRKRRGLSLKAARNVSGTIHGAALGTVPSRWFSQSRAAFTQPSPVRALQPFPGARLLRTSPS